MKLCAPTVLAVAALLGVPAIAQELTSVSAAGDECMKQWEHDCDYDSDCCPGLKCLGYGPYGDTTMCNVPSHLNNKEQSFTKETSDDFKPILADDAPQVDKEPASVAAGVVKLLRGTVKEDTDTAEGCLAAYAFCNPGGSKNCCGAFKCDEALNICI